VVLEERRTRTDNDPSSLLDEQVEAALYIAHPYRKPVIGWMAEVSKLTREDAIDFYRRHYTPKNAFVVIAGDVEPEAVKAMAERIYGAVPAAFEPAPRLRTPEPEPIAARRVVLADARASSPSLSRVYLAPSYLTAGKGEAEALEVLAEILGGSTTSRLYRELVVEGRIAAHTGAWYTGDNADSGVFGVYAAPVPGGDIKAVEAALDEVLRRVAEEGIGEDELSRAKKSLIADTVYALDSQFRLAYGYGVALTSGLTVEAVRDWPERIATVTAEDVKAAALRVLKPERSVTGILLPGGESRATAQN
jgi:zinc protease